MKIFPLISALLLTSAAHAAVIHNPPMEFPGWIQAPCGVSNFNDGWQGVVANGPLFCGAGEIGPSFSWALPANATEFGYVSAAGTFQYGPGGLFPVTNLFERDPRVTLAVTPVMITNELGVTLLMETVIAAIPQHRGVLTVDMAAFAAGVAIYGFIEAPNPVTGLTAATMLGIALAAGADAGLFDPSPLPPDPLFNFETTLDGANVTGSFDGVNSDGEIVGVHNLTFDTPGTVIPEPSTWIMLVIGFGAMSLAFKRKVKEAH